METATLERLEENRQVAAREGELFDSKDRCLQELPGSAAPDAATLLDVDREYRERAAAGTLRKIAPKRFNRDARPWLPVLHTRRGGWHFTALYSNTARAHELHRTHDWVLIYFYDGEHREQQCTVVTETRGALAGSRVVRGHEAQCAAIAFDTRRSA